MSTVTSRDGTTIAFEQSGRGPAIVLVGGTLGDRSQQAPLAALLAERFTVLNYDRRGHGESGDSEPYAVERELEDLGAVLDAAGEPSLVYGTSGCAVLALYAAAAGLAPRIRKLALWEPPFVVGASRPAVPADYREQLTSLLEEGRRGDMVELFMTAAAGLPRELVASMRQAPWWPAQEALAHTLVYDATLMGDFSLPRARIAAGRRAHAGARRRHNPMAQPRRAGGGRRPARRAPPDPPRSAPQRGPGSHRARPGGVLRRLSASGRR